jgi:RNA polymerase sigma-70 factor (ECF subfamily)
MSKPELLERVLSEGTRAWPGVEVDPDQVRAFLKERKVDPGSISDGRAADLFLVCACLQGRPKALPHLETLCRREVGFAVQRLHAPVDEDDALATLLAKLLVSQPGAAPKLSQYAGNAELRRWVRIVVLRHVLNATESHRHDEPLDAAVLKELVSKESREWRTLDPAGREAFQTALARSLASLSFQDRNLLRHRLDGLSVTTIAELYQVHHTTVSRWLSRVGAVVEHAVLGELRDSLRLGRPDLESLVRSLLSQVNSSIRSEVSRALPDDPP